jgi:hypothetical protein
MADLQRGTAMPRKGGVPLRVGQNWLYIVAKVDANGAKRL